MDNPKFLEDLPSYKFEDLEDYVEHVSQKIEEAVFYWKILSDMFMADVPVGVKRKLFDEFADASFSYFDNKLRVFPCPELDGPFTLVSLQEFLKIQ
jgi:hypothetical protein